MMADPDDPRDLRGPCIIRSGFYNTPPEPWYAGHMLPGPVQVSVSSVDRAIKK